MLQIQENLHPLQNDCQPIPIWATQIHADQSNGYSFCYLTTHFQTLRYILDNLRQTIEQNIDSISKQPCFLDCQNLIPKYFLQDNYRKGGAMDKIK